ncbi:MAG: pyridoxal-phosphate dependent enzyme [Ignavibacteria bacterium]|nr:pyridoxal-phosphate dependent enzyme [Ignavibacteria bacterium]
MEITLDKIISAHNRIKPYIHRTPVITSSTLDSMFGANLYFKCENFQKIGAFKIRGALNAALSLPKDSAGKGLATHSSGNHAQAIALSAKLLGTKAYIVMPDNSPKVKINAVRGYGADIYFCEPTLNAREEKMNEVITKTGAVFIHPYNDYRIIFGQATACKELIEETGNLDAVIAPVGGGGLLSGTALSARFLGKQTEVYAGEPEGAADAILSFRSGKIEKASFINTIADGLLTTLGDVTLRIIRKNVNDILLVSDDEIIEALKLVYERLKIVIEPSSAVAFAAFIRHKELFKGKKTGIILSGGNVDTEKFNFFSK